MGIINNTHSRNIFLSASIVLGTVRDKERIIFPSRRWSLHRIMQIMGNHFPPLRRPQGAQPTCSPMPQSFSPASESGHAGYSLSDWVFYFHLMPTVQCAAGQVFLCGPWRSILSEFPLRCDHITWANAYTDWNKNASILLRLSDLLLAGLS